MTARRFHIARNPDISRSEMRLSHPYSRIEDASADMQDGVVFDSNGEIVIFHERHLWLLDHRNSTRMSNA